MNPDATLKLTGLNQMVVGFNRQPLPKAKGEDGEELPIDQQLTLGNVLLALVARTPIEREAKPVEIIIMRRLGELLYDAMIGNGEVEIGSIMLSQLRKAATKNAPDYTPLILAQVWEAIGDGESEQKKK